MHCTLVGLSNLPFVSFRMWKISFSRQCRDYLDGKHDSRTAQVLLFGGHDIDTCTDARLNDRERSFL